MSHSIRGILSMQSNANGKRELEVGSRIHDLEERKQTTEQDGGYGWVCVVAQLLITANTWGINGVSATALGLTTAVF